MPDNKKMKEGWGIAFSKNNQNYTSGLLYISNGSSIINVVDPIKWEIIKEIYVRDSFGNPIENINELEIINK